MNKIIHKKQLVSMFMMKEKGDYRIIKINRKTIRTAKKAMLCTEEIIHGSLREIDYSYWWSTAANYGSPHYLSYDGSSLSTSYDS